MPNKMCNFARCSRDIRDVEFVYSERRSCHDGYSTMTKVFCSLTHLVIFAINHWAVNQSIAARTKMSRTERTLIALSNKFVNLVEAEWKKTGGKVA